MSQSELASNNSGTSRRRFLQWSGAAAAGLGWAGSAFGPALAGRAQEADDKATGGKAIKLGLASYTARKLSLEKAIEVAKRVDLKYICLKSVHMPLEATPETTAATAAKVRQAGLILYGGGVITMTKEAQVTQGFDYAKAAGLGLIVIAPSAEMLPLIESTVKDTNIPVAIHNHGPSDKHFPTPESVYEKVKNLDKRVGLCIDIGHAVRAGVNLVATTERCADRLRDIHMKDIMPADAKGKDVPVGRGGIPMVAFLRTLVRSSVLVFGVTFTHAAACADLRLPFVAKSISQFLLADSVRCL
jgi:inosose dehydratase